MIKKITRLALLSLALAPLHASMAFPALVKGHDVYVPDSCCSNEYSATLLVMRPGGSNDYAVLVSPSNPAVAAPALSPSWEPEGINPHFKLGFALNYRHVFAHTNNDLSFSWNRLHTHHSHTYPVNREPPPAMQMTGPFWDIGPAAIPTNTAGNGQLRNKYDVLSLEFGKSLVIGPDLKTRLFAGISSLWLSQKIEGDFSGTSTTPEFGDYTFNISSKSKFNAGGLRFGMEGEYPTWCNLSGVAMIAGSLFVGSEQPLTETIGTSLLLTDAGIPTNYQSINRNRYIQTVPALDGKLGLKYTAKYRNRNAFIIEGGYMTSILINAIQSYVPSTFVPDTSGIQSGSVYLQSLMKTTESFSVDGPYLKFAMKM